MTIAFDKYTAIGSGTGDVSATHTPVGTPKGVFVTITAAEGGASQFDIGEITYGGVAMESVVQNMTVLGEAAGAAIWFLGHDVPTGAQTVSVQRMGSANADTIFVDCITVTGASDMNPIRNVDGAALGESGSFYSNLAPSTGTPSNNFFSVSCIGTGWGAAPTISTSAWTAVRSTDHGSYGSTVGHDDSERSTGDGICTFGHGSDEATAVVCTVEEGIAPPDVICVGKLFIADTNGGPAVIDLTLLDDLSEDDVIIAAVASDDSTTAVSIVSSGWTSIAHVQPANDCNLRAYWKKMGATVDTAITSATFGATEGVAMCCYVFRGAHATAPVDTSSTASAVAAASFNNASITPGADDGTILFLGAEDSIQSNWPYIPSKLGQLNDVGYIGANDTNDQSIYGGVYYQVGTAAAFDLDVWNTDVAVSAWAAITISIAAAGAATPSGAVAQTVVGPPTQTVTAGVEVNNVVTQTVVGPPTQVVQAEPNKTTGGIIQTMTGTKSQAVVANSPLSGGSGRTRTFSGSGI